MLGNTRRGIVFFAVFVTAAGLAAATSHIGRTVPARSTCGEKFLSLKTLSDPQRSLVNLHPRYTTIAAIDAVPMPNPTPTIRSTAFERQVWRVKARIVEFMLERDSDIHLILFEDGAYLIAEMPLASCLPSTTRDRRAIVAARARFVRRCGQPSFSWQPLGAV